MKTITINIAKQSVSVNGQVCNFIEAGLHNNETPATVLTDRAEIEEVLNDQYEGQEIEVVFKNDPILRNGAKVKVINQNDEHGNFGKVFRIKGTIQMNQYKGMTGICYVVDTDNGECTYRPTELKEYQLIK
jgi:hypothetical protein